MQKTEVHFEVDFQLLPGEEIVWTGRPRQGIYFDQEDWVKVPFFTAWSVFAFGWEFQALQDYRSGRSD